MATVTFRDETAAGKPLTDWKVAGLPEQMTVRELIRLRIREEAARHNTRPSDRYNGLVHPDDAETDLNGYRPLEPRHIDWQRQAEIAERAFLGNEGGECVEVAATPGTVACPRREGPRPSPTRLPVLGVGRLRRLRGGTLTYKEGGRTLGRVSAGRVPPLGLP
ncbi:hypothetical protein SALBM311S_00558 [Streptomyces alboniger]